MRVIVDPQAKQDIDRNAIWWAEKAKQDDIEAGDLPSMNQ